jgi:TfoX/Sxy family transcriptional regulator of competence genes
MPTAQTTVDDLLAHLTDAGTVTARKMFGEYCVYLQAKPVALVCDDTLFVKLTPTGQALVPDAATAPPYSGAKPHLVIPRANWAERATLCRLLKVTYTALPPAKSRPRKPAP